MREYQRGRRDRKRAEELAPFEVVDLRDLRCGGCRERDAEIERLKQELSVLKDGVCPV
jgi:hypothetical protein